MSMKGCKGEKSQKEPEEEIIEIASLGIKCSCPWVKSFKEFLLFTNFRKVEFECEKNLEFEIKKTSTVRGKSRIIDIFGLIMNIPISINRE